MPTITFDVPVEVVERAQQAGILTDSIMTELIIKELGRRQGVDKFFEIIEKLSDIEPTISQEEIDAEIAAYKAERREKRKS